MGVYTQLYTKDFAAGFLVTFLYVDKDGTAYLTVSQIAHARKIGMSVRLVRPSTPQDPPNDADYCEKYIGNDGTKYLTVRIGNSSLVS